MFTPDCKSALRFPFHSFSNFSRGDYMRLRSRFGLPFAALLSTLFVCFAAFGQTVNYTTGSIAGKVSDDAGAGVPGVTVTTTNLDTGQTRTTFTDKNGGYDLSLLPPGNYKVLAELKGLGKSDVPRVTVLLGNTTRTDMKLTMQVSEAVTVTAEKSIIDTTSAGMTQSVTNQQIDSLPLLGRDFRSLASLTPGVSAGSFDPNAITANGARPLSTDFNIDGASSNNDFYGQQTGGTRPPFTFSQAAIQEFQVIRTQYDAEYGRGVGAAVNAITKSGTNDFHGSAFFYDRKASWAANRPTAFDTNFGGTSYPLAVSDSFLAKDVTQPGFVVGGPILRDTLFFFGGFDSMKQSQPVIIGNDMRTYSQFLALTPAQQQTALSRIQSTVGAPYEAGLNYSVDNTLKTYLLKFDGNLGSNHHWSLRDNITNYDTTNSGSTSSFGLNQTNEVDKFYQAVLEVDSVLTRNLSNVFIAQVGRDQRPVTSVYGGTEFSVNFGTTQYFGFNDTTPSTADEKKTQLKDTVQFQWKGHSLKAGAELLHRNLFDAFPRYAAGYYSFNSLANFAAATPIPNTFQQAYGPQNGDLGWNTDLWGFFVNDDYRITPRLTLGLGLRYDYMKTPRPDSNAYPQHPEFLTQIKDDTNNIAPRVGFAWDVLRRPFRSPRRHRQVLRIHAGHPAGGPPSGHQRRADHQHVHLHDHDVESLPDLPQHPLADRFPRQVEGDPAQPRDHRLELPGAGRMAHEPAVRTAPRRRLRRGCQRRLLEAGSHSGHDEHQPRPHGLQPRQHAGLRLQQLDQSGPSVRRHGHHPRGQQPGAVVVPRADDRAPQVCHRRLEAFPRG